MASITKQPNGRRILQVVCPGDGKRRSVHLGKVTQKQAEEVKRRVEHLVAAAATAQSADLSTSRWVSEIDDKLHEKLVKLGIVEPRAEKVKRTVAQLILEFEENRKGVKRSTRRAWQQGFRSFQAFFGGDTDIDTVTRVAADDWRQSMLSEGIREATIRKRTQSVKTLFNWAARRNYVQKSPVDHLPSVRTAGARKTYVSHETALKVIDKLPDHNWRLLFALGRFAGLRLPSEGMALRWSDVDWENDMIRVQVPKLEHIPGKGERTIPIFADLRPYLIAAFEEAEPGEEYVVGPLKKLSFSRISRLVRRAVETAGVERWSYLLHSLRASCETDLMRVHPVHVVCGWIGHSMNVAETHYLQTTRDDIALAVAGPNAVQEAVQQRPATRRNESQPVQQDEGLCDETVVPVRHGRRSQGLSHPCHLHLSKITGARIAPST